MDYEAYEPDPDDEYYDEACSAAYAAMFNGRNERDPTVIVLFD